MFTFLDVGNVYGEEEKMRFSEMRASVGVGMSWISPVGSAAPGVRPAGAQVRWR
jgi:outer membrane protein assembly factor BamA